MSFSLILAGATVALALWMVYRLHAIGRDVAEIKRLLQISPPRY